jgi:hypothetical protein
VDTYEKLGLFYLGKRYDLDRGVRDDDLVLYDSKDLVTHAMCVGMTGSGKTGLGIAMIEEAAIDGVPVLAIDPKGDLSNLLLTFPDLSPADFQPWVDEGDPAAEARRWKSGLAEWDQAPDRIARLKAAAEVRVYTPGSRAGTPLALLSSMGSAAQRVDNGPAEDDGEAAERISSTAAGLLALAGAGDAAPHSREQALVAAILAAAPAHADLAWLVQQIQRPAFDRIGVLDLETFYPAKDRQALALRFNGVLAAPGFDVWLEGEPLDPSRLLFTDAGKPRVAIVSIAHLDDSRRMLVVTLLLDAVLEWTRRQRGTASLRALIYMDEVVGYLPPVANPPSKLPLLTLLKQARAFGVGVMLATQNPVDLDYKALSNIGTWFLGKLQTERDKARVLDGLEGVAGGLDRAALDRTLSALRSRVFLLHDVHEQEPVVFETRWTLSYLRGPLGRDELKRLNAALRSRDRDAGSASRDREAGSASRDREAGSASRDREAGSASRDPAYVRGAGVAEGTPAGHPVVPAGIREVFLGGGASSEYEPVLYAAARVHYIDVKRGVDVTDDVVATVPFADGPIAADWTAATPCDQPPESLATMPPAGSYRVPPADALNPKRYADWSREFVQWIVRARPLPLPREARIRLQQQARESRDAAVAKLRASYSSKLTRLAAKVQQAQEALGREQQQSQQQRLQTAVSFGATLLGAVMGRKTVSMSTLGRATTAARGVSRSVKEAEDVTRAEARLVEAQRDLQAMQAAMEREVAGLTSGAGGAAIDDAAIPAKRTNVEVRLIALGWRPVSSSPMPPTPRS